MICKVHKIDTECKEAMFFCCTLCSVVMTLDKN